MHESEIGTHRELNGHYLSGPALRRPSGELSRSDRTMIHILPHNRGRWVAISAVHFLLVARSTRYSSTPKPDHRPTTFLTLSSRGVSAQDATQHRAEQRVHRTSVQGRFAQAQDCGFETICARASRASAGAAPQHEL